MEKKKKHLLLGAHISIAGGLYKSLERAESIGTNCMQIFTKSNRRWDAKPLTEEEINEFIEKKSNSPLKNILSHAGYLINLGTDKPEILEKSLRSLTEELIRCELLNIPYLVLHPGAYGKSLPQDSLQQISQSLDAILEKNKGETKILLENTAGQGTNLGYQFEQLATLRQQTNHKERIGFCFDTCHAFAAGYDFRNPETYEALWKDFDEIIGLKYLHALHINDSKKGLNSRIDRHEHIGKGELGLDAFSLLFNDPRFFDIPKILETPKEDDLREDVMNMGILKSLLTPHTKDLLGMVE